MNKRAKESFKNWEKKLNKLVTKITSKEEMTPSEEWVTTGDLRDFLKLIRLIKEKQIEKAVFYIGDFDSDVRDRVPRPIFYFLCNVQCPTF